MIRDTEILEYIFSKYKDKERDLNEQYLYLPFSSGSSMNSVSEQLCKDPYEESKTIPKITGLLLLEQAVIWKNVKIQ